MEVEKHLKMQKTPNISMHAVPSWCFHVNSAVKMAENSQDPHDCRVCERHAHRVTQVSEDILWPAAVLGLVQGHVDRSIVV